MITAKEAFDLVSNLEKNKDNHIVSVNEFSKSYGLVVLPKGVEPADCNLIMNMTFVNKEDGKVTEGTFLDADNNFKHLDINQFI